MIGLLRRAWDDRRDRIRFERAKELFADSLVEDDDAPTMIFSISSKEHLAAVKKALGLDENDA
ncbi:MAG TPA: hypothetical protein VKR79_09885 [Gaiellaceae bacterium]|nr:hypothetical protein [Gaiellaceae bacterium]